MLHSFNDRDEFVIDNSNDSNVPLIDLHQVSGHIKQLKGLTSMTDAELKLVAEMVLTQASPQVRCYINVNKVLISQLLASFSPYLSGADEQDALNVAIRMLKVI